ncbi:MAG: hypothetical protein QM656_16900 [Paracoccaceae bacterium]
MARDLKEEKDQTIEELNGQIAELKAQLADMAATLKSRGENVASELRARGEHLADEVRGRARRAYSVASDQASVVKGRAQGYLDEADTAVRENPATAMGVAVGVGFLLGVMLSRR